MPIEKPLPLMVGDKAYYSLTSYEPVEITVEVPYVSDEDLDFGLEMTVRELGGTLQSLDDPAWVGEHFEGLSTRAQVREAMRQEMVAMNEQIAEQQKAGKCIEALSARLAQSIPPAHVEQARQLVQMRFTQELQQEGLTPQQFMQQTGSSTMQIEAMFDRQAQQMAEGEAALSAYAHEKKLKVDEHEIGRLLGMSPSDAQEVIEQARAAGQSSELREAALRAKAAQIVVAECSCTYQHETPEEAHARLAQFRQMQQMLGDQTNPSSDDDKPEQSRSGFKLV